MSKDRVSGYILQENFLNLVAKPELPVKEIPTRSRKCFWSEDVLPTAQMIRKIYVKGGLSTQEEDMLAMAWNWTRDKVKAEWLRDESDPADPDILEKMPLEVFLNRATSIFFATEDDFKSPRSLDRFEAFVSFKPGTKEFENDIRAVTFDYVHKLRTHPYEFGPKIDGALALDNRVYEQVGHKVDGLEKEVWDRFEYVDALTWTFLMQYHLTLFQREKAILSKLNLTY